MDYFEVLKSLSSEFAISGYESKMSIYLKACFGKYCDNVEIDSFYNVIGVKKGKGSNNKKIMISAHYDEIGLLVKGIDEKGFIKFTNIGGIDHKILLSEEVLIHGKEKIEGVIGVKPPHVIQSDEDKKSIKIEDLFIDTCIEYNYIRQKVSIGDAITFKPVPFRLNGDNISLKSMDNRSGVAALISAMEELTKLNFEVDIYFVATVQEEVGLRGATMVAYNINPDLAIVIDACHGTVPDVPKSDIYKLGYGPAVGIGPNLHKKLTDKLVSILEDENLPHQIDIESGDTGTEAWAMQVSRTGIPTCLISIPVKYMHTSIETVNIKDIRNTGKLVSKVLTIAKAEMEEILCC